MGTISESSKRQDDSEGGWVNRFIILFNGRIYFFQKGRKAKKAMAKRGSDDCFFVKILGP